MKEAFCSYEISKLLKEKGFDESSFAYYSEFDDWKILRFWRKYARNPINTFYLCVPTHQMACAWLREKGIYITIIYGDYPANKKVFWTPQIDSLEGFDLPDSFYQEYDLYEDAVESAIKYCLENLI